MASASTKAPRATVCFLVDASAFTRGYTGKGERCEVAGVGPVPVAALRRQLPDSFVKILVQRGVDVTTVVHAGRSVPAHLQSALEVRDPTCVVPGCDVAHGLENHHWEVDYAVCRHTSLAALARVCHWHHGLLTYGGYVLRGGPGAWEMRGPPGGDRFETAPRLETTERSNSSTDRAVRDDRADRDNRAAPTRHGLSRSTPTRVWLCMLRVS